MHSTLWPPLVVRLCVHTHHTSATATTTRPTASQLAQRRAAAAAEIERLRVSLDILVGRLWREVLSLGHDFVSCLELSVAGQDTRLSSHAHTTPPLLPTTNRSGSTAEELQRVGSGRQTADQAAAQQQQQQQQQQHGGADQRHRQQRQGQGRQQGSSRSSRSYDNVRMLECRLLDGIVSSIYLIAVAVHLSCFPSILILTPHQF